MEQASQALGRMDYLSCEADCLAALSLARDAGDWAYYGRILMPLQESRRQRRMIAAEGTIRLGTMDLDSSIAAWLDKFDSGCVVVTHPHEAYQARALIDAGRSARRHVEVLFADNLTTARRWVLATYDRPSVRCEVPAPPADWIGRWIRPQPPAGRRKAAHAPSADVGAADWFIDATEKLGDVALAQIDPAAPPRDRLEALEQRLAVIGDHEILHQRLWDVARALSVEPEVDRS